MHGLTKCLIAGIIILFIGAGILIWGLATNGWKFDVDWKTEEFVCENGITSTDFGIAAGKAKVVFTDDEKASVTYPVSDRYYYSVKEENGTLKITTEHGSFWFITPGYMFGGIPDLIIRLPKSQACDIKLGMSAGTVELPDGAYGNIDISISAGVLNAGRLDCEDFKMKLSAGSAEVTELTADAVDVKLSAGSATVKGIQSDKIDAHLSAGSLDLRVVGNRTDYTATVDKSAGSCNLTERDGNDPNKRIAVKLSAGSVNVSFTEG